MSSCEGFNGLKMAMKESGEFPFGFILGPDSKPSWADANIAFSVFYHNFCKGLPPDRCLAAMNQASGQKFYLSSAESGRKFYLEQLYKSKLIKDTNH